MKINMPITDVEYVLTEADSIVTKTDLSGKITYASDDFIRISGFTKEELIGASHNIVRHPDMPSEVFEDLWSSMKKGYPRSALIKDRCKNGDFFWVWANVAPIYENDNLIGYISVRIKPNREQVIEAADAYKKFREGKAGNLKIKDGKPGSRYFCESFYGHPCPTSGKNYATAHACGGPSRPASFVGYPTRGIQHHSRNDSTRCRKACIFTTQKDAS